MKKVLGKIIDKDINNYIYKLIKKDDDNILTDLDGISENDLKAFSASDPCLKRSCEEYFQDDEEVDEDNYDYDDDREE